MGNTLPVTAPPKPSASRAVIFMKPQCFRSYLKEPWRKPVGKLQILGSTDELPTALDGAVPIEAYREMMKSIEEQANRYRGGVITIGVTMFQAVLLLVLLFGFFFSKYVIPSGKTFFNPITLCVLATLEFGVLSQSGRFFQREELVLRKEMLELLRPWRAEYGIVCKMRKVRGEISIEEQKRSSTYYCLILEKTGPDYDLDTASMSTYTGIESEIDDSDVESQV